MDQWSTGEEFQRSQPPSRLQSIGKSRSSNREGWINGSTLWPWMIGVSVAVLLVSPTITVFFMQQVTFLTQDILKSQYQQKLFIILFQKHHSEIIKIKDQQLEQQEVMHQKHHSEIIKLKDQQLEQQEKHHSEMIKEKEQQKENILLMLKVMEEELELEKKLMQKELELEQEKSNLLTAECEKLKKELRLRKKKSLSSRNEAEKEEQRFKELEKQLSNSKKHIEELQESLKAAERKVSECQKEVSDFDSWYSNGKRFAWGALGCATGSFLTGGGSIGFAFKGFKMAARIGQALDPMK